MSVIWAAGAAEPTPPGVRATHDIPSALGGCRGSERGIDISREFAKPWTDEIVRAADVVVTMGCGDACPVFPGKRYLDWTLDDPAGKTAADVRPIRDEIERGLRGLLDELGVPAQLRSGAGC